jgi:hypothetical protein
VSSLQQALGGMPSKRERGSSSSSFFSSSSLQYGRPGCSIERERERSSSFSRHLNPSVVSPGWPSRPHSCRRAHHPRLQRRRRVLLVVACAVRPRKLDGTSTIIPPTTSYDDNGVTVGRPTRSVYGPYLIRFLVQVEVRPP